MQRAHGFAVADHRQRSPRGDIVRTLHIIHTIEADIVTGNSNAVADSHAHIELAFITFNQSDADDEHGNTAMRQQHAVITGRQRAHPGKQGTGGARTQALTQIDCGSRHDPQRQQQTESHQWLPGAHCKRQQQRRCEADAERPAHALQQLGQGRLFPPGQRRDAHQEQCRRHQRHEHRLEVRRADRQLAKAERIEKQRIQRAEHDGTGSSHQQHVVGQQQGFARNHVEGAAAAHGRRAPGEQQQRSADDQRKEHQNENAAFGVCGKGMHRCQHAGTHEECAQQRHRKRADRQ